MTVAGDNLAKIAAEDLLVRGALNCTTPEELPPALSDNIMDYIIIFWNDVMV